MWKQPQSCCRTTASWSDSAALRRHNQIDGQRNLRDAVRRNIAFTDPKSGKSYQLKSKVSLLPPHAGTRAESHAFIPNKDQPFLLTSISPRLTWAAAQTATLMVRPRGWHLPEKHVLVDGKPVPGAIFDFAMYFFHNAAELAKRVSGPYFYLPKMQSHLEARLWNAVFLDAQALLRVPRGTIKARLRRGGWRATALSTRVTSCFFTCLCCNVFSMCHASMCMGAWLPEQLVLQHLPQHGAK